MSSENKRLASMFKQRKESDEFFRKVKVTKDVYRKMNTYHNIVSSILERNYEVAGVLLAEQGRFDGVAIDTWLFPQQHISAADVNFDPESFALAYDEARKDKKKILGGWHSHGGFGSFHSHADSGYLMSFFINNKHTIPNLFPLDDKTGDFCKEGIVVTQDESGIIIRQRKEHPDSIRIAFDERTYKVLKQSLDLIVRGMNGVQMSYHRGLAYAVSVVINADSASKIEHYLKRGPKCSTKVIYQTQHGADDYVELEDTQTSFEVVDESNGIILDENVLKQEVYDCVYVNGLPIGDYEKDRRKSIFSSVFRKEKPPKDEKVAEVVDKIKIIERKQDEDEQKLKKAFPYQTDDVEKFMSANLLIDAKPSYMHQDMLIDGYHAGKRLLRKALNEQIVNEGFYVFYGLKNIAENYRKVNSGSFPVISPERFQKDLEVILEQCLPKPEKVT